MDGPGGLDMIQRPLMGVLGDGDSAAVKVVNGGPNHPHIDIRPLEESTGCNTAKAGENHNALLLAPDDGRIDHVQIATRTRGTVSRDDMKRSLEKSFDMFAWIADRRGRANKCRAASVHLANAQQTPHDVGDVRTKGSAIRVHFINDDESQPR